jgi:hypothetical protein
MDVALPLLQQPQRHNHDGTDSDKLTTTGVDAALQRSRPVDAALQRSRPVDAALQRCRLTT